MEYWNTPPHTQQIFTVYGDRLAIPAVAPYLMGPHNNFPVIFPGETHFAFMSGCERLDYFGRSDCWQMSRYPQASGVVNSVCFIPGHSTLVYLWHESHVLNMEAVVCIDNMSIKQLWRVDNQWSRRDDCQVADIGDDIHLFVVKGRTHELLHTSVQFDHRGRFDGKQRVSNLRLDHLPIVTTDESIKIAEIFECSARRSIVLIMHKGIGSFILEYVLELEKWCLIDLPGIECIQGHWVFFPKENLLISFGGTVHGMANDKIYGIQMRSGLSWRGVRVRGWNMPERGEWNAVYLKKDFEFKFKLVKGYAKKYSPHNVPSSICTLVALWHELGPMHLILADNHNEEHLLMEPSMLDEVIHTFRG